MNPVTDKLNAGGAASRSGVGPSGGAAAAECTFQPHGIGSMVFNRYSLQRVLGRGAMGVVWLATDTKLERLVALKFLPDQIGTDPLSLKELKDETRLGLDLAHPNIVRVYDFVDDAESAAISMEFVDGKSLAELRLEKPHQIFSVEEIRQWFAQICDALDYAHWQRHLVHRDLKPANLMVDESSNIKITDFGIARSVSDSMSKMSRSLIGTSGTLLYMSPQQTMGDRPKPTDDIYSLGAPVYELLTGKPPFYTGDVTTQILHKQPPPMRERRAEL
jgi:serine/threonine protein kinase